MEQNESGAVHELPPNPCERRSPEENQQPIAKEQLPDMRSEKEQMIFGLAVRTWTLIVLISIAIAIGFFIVMPFVITLIVQLIPGYDIEQLIDVIDGVALVVGITGTAASIASIVMTLADKKRYNQEKSQMQELFRSVSQLHDEVDVVAQTAKNTLLQNTRMGEALFAGKIIPFNHNMVNMSSNINGDAKTGWEDSGRAHELSLSKHPTVNPSPQGGNAEGASDEQPT